MTSHIGSDEDLRPQWRQEIPMACNTVGLTVTEYGTRLPLCSETNLSHCYLCKVFHIQCCIAAIPAHDKLLSFVIILSSVIIVEYAPFDPKTTVFYNTHTVQCQQ